MSFILPKTDPELLPRIARAIVELYEAGRALPNDREEWVDSLLRYMCEREGIGKIDERISFLKMENIYPD